MVKCTLATIFLAHDLLSSLAYPMINHTPPVAGNLPIRQWPTRYNITIYQGQEVQCIALTMSDILSYRLDITYSKFCASTWEEPHPPSAI